jgi:hypothetical protein
VLRSDNPLLHSASFRCRLTQMGRSCGTEAAWRVVPALPSVPRAQDMRPDSIRCS